MRHTEPDYTDAHLYGTDMRQFRFVRDSRLPLGTFPRRVWLRRINPDRVVFAVCIAIVLALVAVTGAV